MSAADLSKRQKAKGLMPLRFYCQVCEKGYREAHPFKQHQKGEAHLRNMALFRERPDKFLAAYSAQFEAAFLEALRGRGRGTEVNANALYQEVIRDRGHTHMTATYWATLSDFAAYLGKTGKAGVRLGEDGSFYVTHTHKDAGQEAREEEARRREERESKAAAREARRVERVAREAAKGDQAAGGRGLEATAVAPVEKRGAVGFRMGGGGTKARAAPTLEELAAAASSSSSSSSSAAKRGQPATELERMTAEGRQKKRRRHEHGRADAPWVSAGLVVRAVSGAHKRVKGEVTRADGHRCTVAPLKGGGAAFEADQRELETVIPAAGRAVRVVGPGPHEGVEGTLARLHTERFSAGVLLPGGGREVELPLERVCKVAK